MGKRVDQERDAREQARMARIAQAWISFGAKVESANPQASRWFKSFSVRYAYRGDQPYGARYFVVLRAQNGADDLVKFRQLNDLQNLPHVLLDMWRSDVGWREDKWGTQGNLE